ncbi:MAG: shikimate dehydrogenase [Caulobacteraceae bacterium]
MTKISGAAHLAGVVGAPVRQSLSPLIHNAWIAALGLDAVYAPFELSPDGFEAFVTGLRGGSVRGLNVTIPFKERALALADVADEAASAAGAANLLVFHENGRIEARNTDGLGVVAALADQAPELDLRGAPVVVLGAGGAARGAVPALLAAGAREVVIVNRTLARAESLAAQFGTRVRGRSLDDIADALASPSLILNATSGGMNDRDHLDLPLELALPTAVVMDMVYKPLRTSLLRRAERLGLQTVDGLAMLIGQAKPSFEAFFGVAPPAGVDVRGLALQALGERP